MLTNILQHLSVPDKGDFKLSGNYSPLGFLIACGLSATLSVFGGYLYAVLVTFMPFIYLNLLINVGFGVMIGFSVSFLCKRALIRNIKIRYFIGLLTSIIGLMAHWWVYLFLITIGKIPLEHTVSEGSFLIDPMALKNIIIALYTYGNWSFFGIDINGAMLTCIWVGEALVILGAPLLILYKHPIPPFSEKYMKWYSKATLAQDFAYVSGIVSFIQELRGTGGTNLLHYPKGDGRRHSIVCLYYHEKEELAFVSVDNVFISKGSNSRKEVDPIVRFIAIPSEIARSLVNKFGKKKWSLLTM